MKFSARSVILYFIDQVMIRKRDQIKEAKWSRC